MSSLTNHRVGLRSKGTDTLMATWDVEFSKRPLRRKVLGKETHRQSEYINIKSITQYQIESKKDKNNVRRVPILFGIFNSEYVNCAMIAGRTKQRWIRIEIQTALQNSFNYFKYKGSLTSPPCEENIVWFVHSNPLPLGTTSLRMLRDALFAPGKTAMDKEPNFDGSNR